MLSNADMSLSHHNKRYGFKGALVIGGLTGLKCRGVFMSSAAKPAVMPHDFQSDIEAIAAIPSVGDILEIIRRTTGMRFAAVARVTEDRWICCASKDDLNFGLKPGSELWIETTICHEI